MLNSATGAVIPSEFRDIYQSPCKQDLIGIKSYVAKKSFSQQAKHGDGLDYSKISRNAAIINRVKWRQEHFAKSTVHLCATTCMFLIERRVPAFLHVLVRKPTHASIYVHVFIFV